MGMQDKHQGAAWSINDAVLDYRSGSRIPWIKEGSQLPFLVGEEIARALLQMGRSNFLRDVYAGIIPSRKRGTRRMYLVTELLEYAKGLPIAAPTVGAKLRLYQQEQTLDEFASAENLSEKLREIEESLSLEREV